MVDDNDPKEGRTPEDDIYADVEDSGVHRLIRVYDETVRRNESLKPVPVATPDDIRMFIERRLALQEIYGVRKQMRDAFRGFAERNQWLGNLFGTEHIPEITAQQIAKEEDERQVHRMRKFAMKETGVHPLSAHAELSKSELDKPREVMSAEEYAKYVAGKYRYLIQNGDYKKWRDTMLKYQFKLGAQRESDAFYAVITYEAEKAFAEILNSGEIQKIPDAFMYLGGISLFEPEILYDVPKAAVDNAEVRDSFTQTMALLLGVHPELYFKVRNHLIKLGFFRDNEEIDWHPVVVESARKVLKSALHFDQGLFMRYRNLYVEQGYSLQLTGVEEDGMREIIYGRLREAARISPGKYMALRKQLETNEVMDGDAADSDDEVRWLLLGHRQRWEEIHPWALNKLQYYWRANDLSVMDKVSPREFENHENEALRGDPRNAVPSDYGPIPKGMDPEDTAQRVLNYVEREKERYAEFEREIEKLSIDYLDFDSGKLREAYRKFPQYYDKNFGKGYAALQIN
jgi:hypothetical protein